MGSRRWIQNEVSQTIAKLMWSNQGNGYPPAGRRLNFGGSTKGTGKGGRQWVPAEQACKKCGDRAVNHNKINCRSCGQVSASLQKKIDQGKFVRRGQKGGGKGGGAAGRGEAAPETFMKYMKYEPPKAYKEVRRNLGLETEGVKPSQEEEEEAKAPKESQKEVEEDVPMPGKEEGQTEDEEGPWLLNAQDKKKVQKRLHAVENS